ncbi:MAG: FHA domain-containing protein, partial [Myxococcota bacterium]
MFTTIVVEYPAPDDQDAAPGPARREVHEFRQMIIHIGRLKNNDLVLSSPGVARRHARIMIRG